MIDRTDERNHIAPLTDTPLGLLRLCLVVAACLVLVGCATLGQGASPAPANGASPGAAATAESGDDGEADENDQDEGNKGNGNKDDGGRFGGITIKSINGSRIGLATEDGWTRTIDITTETVIRRGDAAATAADLKVGDDVRIRQRRNADGSFTIVAIIVRIPRAAGEVTGVNGNAITVKVRGGITLTINVTSSTTYKLGPNAGSKSDVKVGSRIAAEGERATDGSFTASAIRIALAELSGEVTAKTSASITIKLRDGTSKTVHVASGTVYKIRGPSAAAQPSLADIVVGSRIEAEGTLRSDGSLDAVVVQVGKVKGPKPKASPGG